MLYQKSRVEEILDNYIYKLTKSISSKLYIFGKDMLWKSCSEFLLKQLVHSTSLPIIYSLEDIDIVSLFI